MTFPTLPTSEPSLTRQMLKVQVVEPHILHVTIELDSSLFCFCCCCCCFSLLKTKLNNKKTNR